MQSNTLIIYSYINYLFKYINCKVKLKYFNYNFKYFNYKFKHKYLCGINDTLLRS
jgi:hypothetical protein